MKEILITVTITIKDDWEVNKITFEFLQITCITSFQMPVGDFKNKYPDSKDSTSASALLMVIIIIQLIISDKLESTVYTGSINRTHLHFMDHFIDMLFHLRSLSECSCGDNVARVCPQVVRESEPFAADECIHGK